jgi:hypothetical protein
MQAITEKNEGKTMSKLSFGLFTTALAAFVLFTFFAVGCAPADDTPKIDPVVAKQQPGANVPPAPANGVTVEQLKKAKSGD